MTGRGGGCTGVKPALWIVTTREDQTVEAAEDVEQGDEDTRRVIVTSYSWYGCILCRDPYLHGTELENIPFCWVVQNYHTANLGQQNYLTQNYCLVLSITDSERRYMRRSDGGRTKEEKCSSSTRCAKSNLNRILCKYMRSDAFFSRRRVENYRKRRRARALKKSRKISAETRRKIVKMDGVGKSAGEFYACPMLQQEQKSSANASDQHGTRNSSSRLRLATKIQHCASPRHLLLCFLHPLFVYILNT